MLIGSRVAIEKIVCSDNYRSSAGISNHNLATMCFGRDQKEVFELHAVGCG